MLGTQQAAPHASHYAPCTQLHATGSTAQLITQHLATGSTAQLITQHLATGSTAQLITQHLTRRTQHLARRTTQQSSLIEEFHRKMQDASSAGLPRVPGVIFQRFNIFCNIYLSTSTFNFNIYVIIHMIVNIFFNLWSKSTPFNIIK